MPAAASEPAVDDQEDLVPTYQYACTACDHQFDAVQSFADDSLTVCPQCAGRLRKVFAAVGVVFKGSGFYRTDSRAPEKVNGSARTDSSGDKADSKQSVGKESGSKDSGSKDSGSKDSGSNGSRPKDSRPKDSRGSGSREPAGTGSANTSSSNDSRKGPRESAGKGAGASRSSTGSGSAA